MSQVNFDFNPLEFCLMSLAMQEGDCKEVEELAKYLNYQTPYKLGNIYENFGQEKGLPPPSKIENPK